MTIESSMKKAIDVFKKKELGEIRGIAWMESHYSKRHKLTGVTFAICYYDIENSNGNYESWDYVNISIINDDSIIKAVIKPGDYRFMD